MDDKQFYTIIESFEIRKKVDKIIESKIFKKNIEDINKFIEETDKLLYKPQEAYLSK